MSDMHSINTLLLWERRLEFENSSRTTGQFAQAEEILACSNVETSGEANEKQAAPERAFHPSSSCCPQKRYDEAHSM